MTDAARTAAERRADTLARLEGDADAWVATASAGQPVARCYATRTGWDPGQESVPHVYLIMTPRTMRAWNSLAELTGRTIMRDGGWASP